MESLGHEVVPFEDVVCQMWDMLKLGDRSYVTLQVNCRLASVHIFLNSRQLSVMTRQRMFFGLGGRVVKSATHTC